MAQRNKQRVVLISHSYGTNVALAFLAWAEAHEPLFMSKYIAYYVNVGGTTLGLPKAVSALLLGDAKDTISIPKPARRVLDTFISQAARYEFARTWGSLVTMLPRGCSGVHGTVLVLPNGTAANMHSAALLIKEQCT
uniref:Phospholipid:diacylglycerol acyltransferase n=1 Tax=Lygus hesperus TaxID=30085 RepID=A0A0A9YPD2_LYGHE